MSSVSKAEGQRKLSLILSEKRKKDPVGLLRAQRNGTLDEYLREDLAKYGLAVANVTPAGAGASSSAVAAPSVAAASGVSGVTPATAKASSSSSWASSGRSSSQRATHGPSSSADKPVTSRWRTDQSRLTPPPSASASTASSTSLAAPGKLNASRFESFRGGSPRAEESQRASHNHPAAGGGSRGVRSAIGVASGATGTVPSAGVSAVETTQGKVCEDGKSAGGDEAKGVLACRGSSPPAVSGAAQAQEDIAVNTPSVGGLAERFGGSLRVSGGRKADTQGRAVTSVPPFDSSAGGASSTPAGSASVEGRSGGSRIAELARRFEHKTPGAE